MAKGAAVSCCLPQRTGHCTATTHYRRAMLPDSDYLWNLQTLEYAIRAGWEGKGKMCFFVPSPNRMVIQATDVGTSRLIINTLTMSLTTRHDTTA